MNQVFIIDDSPQIRRRIVMHLAQCPEIRVAGEAGSGSEALAALERVRPDTLILDIHLPDMSGITLLKAFKARYPELTVIMLTNFDDARYKRRCLRLGADYFLSKCKDFEKIADTVRRQPAH